MKSLRGDHRASVWSRGIDPTLFRPGRRDVAWRRVWGIADDEIVVLFFGRLVLEKGVAVFVQAVAELQSKGLRVRPLLVGAGPARNRFNALAGVIEMGHLQGADLARAVASADIMLTPSTTETFGNVVLEAMASGLPVVSADAPSARALIQDNVDGFLCAPREVGAYVVVLEQLIASSDLRQSIGTSASRSSEVYSWDAASDSVERAYRDVARAGE